MPFYSAQEKWFYCQLWAWPRCRKSFPFKAFQKEKCSSKTRIHKRESKRDFENELRIPWKECDQKLVVFILQIYIMIAIQNAILLKIHFSLMIVNTHLIRFLVGWELLLGWILVKIRNKMQHKSTFIENLNGIWSSTVIFQSFVVEVDNDSTVSHQNDSEETTSKEGK